MGIGGGGWKNTCRARGDKVSKERKEILGKVFGWGFRGFEGVEGGGIGFVEFWGLWVVVWEVVGFSQPTGRRRWMERRRDFGGRRKLYWSV